MKKKKVAIIGTNGIPAKYGGFETLADNLTKTLNSKIDFIVYCSKFKYKDRPKYYNNSRLIHVPLKANGWQSFFYDFLCQIHALFIADTVLILGPSAGLFLFMNKIINKKVIVNYGGLNEWERGKYNYMGRKVIKINYWAATRFSTTNITDNTILSSSLLSTFKAQSINIAYGGDHTFFIAFTDLDLIKYPFLNQKFSLSVSRAQIDNNIHLLIDAYKGLPDKILVIVANWEVTHYGIQIKEKYGNLEIPNIYLLNAIYDTNELNLLRSNATIYIHSHSQCGTAPSLVEAMCLHLPVISYDALTNRETTDNEALYFNDSKSLKELISLINESTIFSLKQKMSSIASKKYQWEMISQQYADLF